MRYRNLDDKDEDIIAFVPVAFAVIVMLVLSFLIYGFVLVPNKAIALEEAVNLAEADVKVQEKRRADLISSLADCVKQYDEYEAQVFKDVAEKRSEKLSKNIVSVADDFKAVAENYPDLKSSENYKVLMNELSMTENLVAQYRSNYDDCVRNYKWYVRQTPQKSFLSSAGYKVQEYTYLTYNVKEEE